MERYCDHNASSILTQTILALGLLAYVLLWFACPHQFIASDPWSYSLRSHTLAATGQIAGNHVFDHRFGITLPVALAYKVLGVSILSTNLWPLCAGLLIVTTVWAALPDQRSRLLGVVLCITSVPLLKGAEALYPDVVATAFMALSSLLLFERTKTLETLRLLPLVAATAVACLFFAFLSKLSAYWVLPLWFIAFFQDARRAQSGPMLCRFYLPALATGCILGGAYLVVCD